MFYLKPYSDFTAQFLIYQEIVDLIMELCIESAVDVIMVTIDNVILIIHNFVSEYY